MHKICPLKEQRNIAEGHTCQVPAMFLAQGRCCLFITLGSADSRAEETRALSKYSYLPRNLLDRDIAARGQQPNAHISHASVSCFLHFIISCLLPPGYISRRELIQDFLNKTSIFIHVFSYFLFYCKWRCHYEGGLWKDSLVMFSTTDQMQTNLVEGWHRSRSHDQSNADDWVAVESISIGHHYNACYGQDSSYYLWREKGEHQRMRDRQHAASSMVIKTTEPLLLCRDTAGTHGTLFFTAEASQDKACWHN